MRRRMLVAVGAVAGALAAPNAGAQVLDLHAIGSVETMNQSTSWGAGLAVGTVVMPAGITMLGLAAGADYIREQHLGEGRVSAALDATLAPPNVNAGFVPYVGGSVGLHWSGGQYARWTGSRVGLDVLVGVKALIGRQERMGWKLEQRFGYVQGFDHALATRLGLLIGF
jgi:hypothetical protein